jgi:hypothetical protein
LHKEIPISILKVRDFEDFDENNLFEMPFKRKIRVSNVKVSQSGKTYFFIRTDDFQEFKIYKENLTEKIQFILKKADGFVTDGYDALQYVTFENLKNKKPKNSKKSKKILVKMPLWLANNNDIPFGEIIEKFRYINFEFVGESKKGICVYSKELNKNLWLPKSMIQYENQE